MRGGKFEQLSVPWRIFWCSKVKFIPGAPTLLPTEGGSRIVLLWSPIVILETNVLICCFVVLFVDLLFLT